MIVQVKDNQPTLLQQIQDICATTLPLTSANSHDIGRNRDERRRVAVFEPASRLAGTDWQDHVATIIRIERTAFTRNSKTGLLHQSAETAFYISNAPLPAARAAEAIRPHWKVETTSPYSRDVTMREDAWRIRTNTGIAARLRSFAFNILKANRISTLPQDRYRAALAGLDNLLNHLAVPKN